MEGEWKRGGLRRFLNLDLKNMDASELWKGVLQSQMIQGSNGDTRAAEQRITPWQDDAAVSKCPLCVASFHPLTNRKHHCRLCGTIICSLPPKLPQRQSPCSVLFVVMPRRGASRRSGRASITVYVVRVPARRRNFSAALEYAVAAGLCSRDSSIGRRWRAYRHL